MRLWRRFRWFDATRHEEVEQELAARERDIVDLAARLSRLLAEIEGYRPPSAEHRQQGTR